MERTKQDKVMDAIIYSVTHGEKKAKDSILTRDYDLQKTQFCRIFKNLSEEGVLERTISNVYIVKENADIKAQEMYFQKILEEIQLIKSLAKSANISAELLKDVFNKEISK
ncbi:MAG: hypothetical protein IJ366_07760 [Clostridia bacterium]|nr:hypothetical protein [Clostridia bacterium]